MPHTDCQHLGVDADEEHRDHQLSCIAVIVCAVVIVLLAMFGERAHTEWTRISLLRGAQVGMTKQAVIDHLGPPSFTVTSADQFTGGDRWLPVPKYPMEKEVLEYYRLVWKLYVYIDSNGRVSRVVLART